MFDYNWYVGKQLKQVDRYAPNHLADCLIIHCDEYNGQYHILRVEVNINSKVRYLDLITNCYGTFITVGGVTTDLNDSFNVSKSICEALNTEIFLKEAV
jgi:hypothetical protein